MKTLSLPLFAFTMLLAAPVPCCAAPATTSTQAPVQGTQTERTEKKDFPTAVKAPTERATEKKAPNVDFDDDEDDDERDDDDLDDEEDFDEENVSAPYPFGELKLEQGVKTTDAVAAGSTSPKTDQGSKTAIWKADLPAKGFMIRSEWDEKPEFQNAARPDGKPQGAATLAMQQISDQEQQPFSLYVLMYIYDPEAVGIAMTSPEKVIEQLITAPAEEAKQYGFVSAISDLPATKPVDARQLQDLGVLKDIRKKVGIGQQDKTLYSQFYRLFIGKDFVVLGLVLGGEEGLEKKAQTFFDRISLVPSGKPAVTTPVVPVKPAVAPVTPAPAINKVPVTTPKNSNTSTSTSTSTRP